MTPWTIEKRAREALWWDGVLGEDVSLAKLAGPDSIASALPFKIVSAPRAERSRWRERHYLKQMRHVSALRLKNDAFNVLGDTVGPVS